MTDCGRVQWDRLVTDCGRVQWDSLVTDCGRVQWKCRLVTVEYLCRIIHKMSFKGLLK